MPDVNTSTGGAQLTPADPGYISALNALGYSFGEGTPAWVFDSMPPVYAPAAGAVPLAPPPFAQPPIPPLPPNPTITLPPTSSATPTPSRVPPPGQPGQPGVVFVTPPPDKPVRIGDLNPFGDIGDRILGTLGDGVKAAFDATQSVASRIAGTVRDLAEATLPTIEELATAVASTATGALGFIADNLTDMTDFGMTLAGALVEPLYALLDAGGDKMREWLLALLGALSRAIGGVRGILTASAQVEQLI